jgi:hypothetical protein
LGMGGQCGIAILGAAAAIRIDALALADLT